MRHHYRAWFVFYLFALANIVLSFHQIYFGVMGQSIIEELKIPLEWQGLLGASFFYVYALMLIPAGIFIDKYGTRRTMIIGLTSTAILGFLCAFTNNYITFFCLRLLLGCSNSFLSGCSLKYIGNHFPRHVFARVMGFYLTLCACGYLIATYPLALTLEYIDWRQIFILISCLSLFCCIVFMIFHKASKRPKYIQSSTKVSLKSLFQHKEMCFLLLWITCQGGINIAYAGIWGGNFLCFTQSLDTQDVGVVLGLFASALLWSPLAVALAEKKFKSRKKVLLLVAIATSIMCLPLVFIDSGSLVFWSIHALILGACTGSFTGIIYAAARDLFPIKALGMVSGLLNMSLYAGGAFVQSIFGFFVSYLQSSYTLSKAYHLSFSFFILCTLLALYAALRMKEDI